MRLAFCGMLHLGLTFCLDQLVFGRAIQKSEDKKLDANATRKSTEQADFFLCFFYIMIFR